MDPLREIVCFGHLKDCAGQMQREMLEDTWVYGREHYSRQGTLDRFRKL